MAQRARVDLPQPDSPTKPRVSPRRSSKETPSRAGLSLSSRRAPSRVGLHQPFQPKDGVFSLKKRHDEAGRPLSSVGAQRRGTSKQVHHLARRDRVVTTRARRSLGRN